jgi:hypothetical protein
VTKFVEEKRRLKKTKVTAKSKNRRKKKTKIGKVEAKSTENAQEGLRDMAA